MNYQIYPLSIYLLGSCSSHKLKGAFYFFDTYEEAFYKSIFLLILLCFEQNIFIVASHFLCNFFYCLIYLLRVIYSWFFKSLTFTSEVYFVVWYENWCKLIFFIVLFSDSKNNLLNNPFFLHHFIMFIL